MIINDTYRVPPTIRQIKQVQDEFYAYIDRAIGPKVEVFDPVRFNSLCAGLSRYKNQNHTPTLEQSPAFHADLQLENFKQLIEWMSLVAEQDAPLLEL
jgi:hypothetical protein